MGHPGLTGHDHTYRYSEKQVGYMACSILMNEVRPAMPLSCRESVVDSSQAEFQHLLWQVRNVPVKHCHQVQHHAYAAVEGPAQR